MKNQIAVETSAEKKHFTPNRCQSTECCRSREWSAFFHKLEARSLFHVIANRPRGVVETRNQLFLRYGTVKIEFSVVFIEGCSSLH